MMLARCPACQTVFRARPEQLRAHAGKVRCGHCYQAFNALDHLIDAPEQKPASTSDADRLAQRESRTLPPPAGIIAQHVPKDLAVSISDAGRPGQRPEVETLFILEDGMPSDSPPSSASFTPPSGPGAASLPEHAEDDRFPPFQASGEILSLDHELDFALPEPVSSSARKTPSSERPGTRLSSPSSNALPGDGIEDASSLGLAIPALRDTQPVREEDAPRSTARAEAQPGEQPKADTGRFGSGETEKASQATGSGAPPLRSRRFAERKGDTSPPGQASQPIDPSGDGYGWVERATEEAADTGGRPSTDYQPPLRRYPRNHGVATRPDTPADAAAEAPAEDAADFSHYQRTRTDTPRRWFGGLLAGILLGTLAVQSAYLFRLEITRAWPQLRPVYLSVCQQLGCDMPLPREASEIRITSSDLESDPANPTRLVLNARLRNQAAYPQAHPHLEITLTDVRDRPIVRRVLLPEEWTDAARLTEGLAAGEEATIRLPLSTIDVAEATGYRLYAFYP